MGDALERHRRTVRPPLSTCKCSVEQLLFECRDTHVRSVKLAAQEFGGVDRGFRMEGKRLEFRESLAKTIDFQGPAGLVGLLTVLGQGRCCAQSVEFVV